MKFLHQKAQRAKWMVNLTRRAFAWLAGFSSDAKGESRSCELVMKEENGGVSGPKKTPEANYIPCSKLALLQTFALIFLPQVGDH